MSSESQVSAFPYLASMDAWMKKDLGCIAGRREFSQGRYEIKAVKDGVEFRQAIDTFLEQVSTYKKIALLCIFPTVHEEITVIQEYRRLAFAMKEAGLTDAPDDLLSGTPLRLIKRMPCPVTGEAVDYNFYPVCFTRNATDVNDELYDPALSTPFTAINVTSDAFSVAMFTRDKSIAIHGVEPFQLDRERCADLLKWAVVNWNKMSQRTILNFSGENVHEKARLSISPDGMWWNAPHNDPVFAEEHKAMHRHEMPIQYVTQLADKWMAALFDGETLQIGSEGQSGGSEL